MTALDDIWLGEQSSYYTPKGDYLHFYNKNFDFAFVSDLQLKDRLWAKYWWSADGQCLDREGYGFDRDFYFEKSSQKYYNCRSNQANKGEHKYYTTKTNMLGFWYNNNMYNNISKTMRNNVCIYYISSEFANFESNLMKIAQAVKLSGNQDSRIFYPNAKITPSNCYYNVNIKGSTIDTKLSKSSKLEIKDSGDAEFGR